MSRLVRSRIRLSDRRRRRLHAPDWSETSKELLARLAPGRSFIDVGCMWGIHGRIVFAAEEQGASQVTGVDLMEPTEEYLAEHRRRNSRAEFFNGDINEKGFSQRLGVHDIVWCAGVLFHVPSPLDTLERLSVITGDTLVLGCSTIPEIPGVPQTCVLYPGLNEQQRGIFADAVPDLAIGVRSPFQRPLGYANWWWGITPSALRAMVEVSGFEVVEERTFPEDFNTLVVASKRDRTS